MKTQRRVGHLHRRNPSLSIAKSVTTLRPVRLATEQLNFFLDAQP